MHGNEQVHDINASITLPSIKLEIARVLIDYNNDIERKVAEAVEETISTFDLSTHIGRMTNETVEHKFKQAIEYAINKKVAEMSSIISQAAHDIVNDRLGDE